MASNKTIGVAAPADLLFEHEANPLIQLEKKGVSSMLTVIRPRRPAGPSVARYMRPYERAEAARQAQEAIRTGLWVLDVTRRLRERLARSFATA